MPPRSCGSINDGMSICVAGWRRQGCETQGRARPAMAPDPWPAGAAALGLSVHDLRHRHHRHDQRQGARTFWGDYHRLAGIWSIPFVAIIGVTGTWFFLEGLLSTTASPSRPPGSRRCSRAGAARGRIPCRSAAGQPGRADRLGPGGASGAARGQHLAALERLRAGRDLRPRGDPAVLRKRRGQSL